MAVLTKRIALVTGGSRGIGRAVAISLAQAGAAVAINYRENATEARHVIETIRGFGGRAMAVAADALANMPTLAPGPAQARALAAGHNLIPLRHSFIEDCETPVSAFLKLRELVPGEPAFLLESADQGQRPPPAGDGGRQSHDAKRGDRCVDSIRSRYPESGNETVEPAAEKRSPKAQEEDRAGRRRHHEPEDEAAQQQAGHPGRSSAEF